MSRATPPVRVAILGASGRMGQSLVRALAGDGGFELVGALAGSGSRALGADAGTLAGLAAPLGIAVTAERGIALAAAEVALDFTLPGATLENLTACAERRCALLVGTTGLDAEALAALEAAARSIPVLLAPNTSLGVNLLAELVAKAAAALPEAYDVEIFEAHHRDKRDAPSGTARLLGAAAAAGRRRPAAAAAPRGGTRQPGAIGYASLRGGDLAGDHTVWFLGDGERLELTHRAQDRAVFARGALVAGAWLRGKPPGRYAMADVLGLR